MEDNVWMWVPTAPPGIHPTVSASPAKSLELNHSEESAAQQAKSTAWISAWMLLLSRTPTRLLLVPAASSAIHPSTSAWSALKDTIPITPLHSHAPVANDHHPIHIIIISTINPISFISQTNLLISLYCFLLHLLFIRQSYLFYSLNCFQSILIQRCYACMMLFIYDHSAAIGLYSAFSALANDTDHEGILTAVDAEGDAA